MARGFALIEGVADLAFAKARGLFDESWITKEL